VLLEQGKRTLARKQLTYINSRTASEKLKKKVALMRLYIDKEYKPLTDELNNKKQLSDEQRYLKGISQRKQHYFSSAFKTFEQISSSTQFSWRIQIQKARMTRSRQEYAAAIKQYNALLNHNKGAAFLWFEAALTHEKLLQFTAGIDSVKQAIQLQPTNRVYRLTHARLLDQSGQTKPAIEALTLVLDSNPKYARALRLMGEFFTKTNDRVQLIQIYKRLLAINPDDPDTLYKFAQAMESQGDLPTAQALLSNLLELKSNHIEARYLLAQSYYKNGQLSDSLSEIGNLLRLNANHAPAKSLKNTIKNSQQVETK
ncbi:tetratricopeptide repeat protein, partial [Pseudomonadota bacterium]